jgi:hypothetical protein
MKTAIAQGDALSYETIGQKASFIRRIIVGVLVKSIAKRIFG